jgi:CheY-like chemotaxis protein
MTAISLGAEGTVSVLVIGQLRAREFESLKDELHRLASVIRSDVRRCLRELDGSETPPEVLIVLQRHPDEYSVSEIHRLLSQFPLARLLVCCGPWCDSSGRTRDDWPLASRTGADLVTARLHQELEVVCGRQPPLPVTANRDERWIADHSTVLSSRAAGRSIAVETADLDVQQLMVDALAAAGFDCAPYGPRQTDILLWDADPWSEDLLRRIEASRRQNSAQSILALAGFHRPQETQQLLNAGVASVISKLSPLHVLIDAVEQVAAMQSKDSPAPCLRVVSSA